MYVLTDTTTYLVIILAFPVAALAGILVYRTTKKQKPIVAVIREHASWHLRQDSSKAYDIDVAVSLQNMGANTTIRRARLTIRHAGREYYPDPKAEDTPVELSVGKTVKQQYGFHLAQADITLTDVIDSATLRLTDTYNKDYIVTFERIPRHSQ
jgi:hypothetical protein